MKALQVVRPRTFERVEVPVPRLPGENGRVLVRNQWALTCGSDIPFYTGNKRYRSYPLAPGAPIHECVGVVAESSSDRFHPGGRVLAIPDGDLGLAEYFLALATKTVLLDPAIEDGAAACIIQPLSTVLGSIDRIGDLGGKSVAVLGLGAIGLMFCWLARRAGAADVIGIDPCPDRCRFAASFGATRTLCRRGIEAVQDARAGVLDWAPPDICIEAVGHQRETINDCLEIIRREGTVVAFGVPDQPVYALEYEIFFRKNAQLVATVTPDWPRYLARAHELFLECGGELSRLVTHRMPVRDAASAFSMYERHEAGMIKAALDMTVWC
jgi:threonine dehydrogenase-like Zn-dependent dehydrogenase